MAAAAAGALAALVPTVLGALGNQRSSVAAAAPAGRLESSTAAIALAPTNQARRAAAANADKERLFALLTDPQILGLLTVFGGLLVANKIRFSDNYLANKGLRSMATASSILLGLGRAGVGDLTCMSMAAAAGAISMADPGSGSGSGSGGSAASALGPTGDFWSDIFNPAAYIPGSPIIPADLAAALTGWLGIGED